MRKRRPGKPGNEPKRQQKKHTRFENSLLAALDVSTLIEINTMLVIMMQTGTTTVGGTIVVGIMRTIGLASGLFQDPRNPKMTNGLIHHLQGRPRQGIVSIIDQDAEAIYVHL
jgi:hypothetical protein